MTIIGFIGLPRTGKTLFMVYNAYNNMLLGHEILSNVKLFFPYKPMHAYDMLKIPFSVMDRDNKTLLIQEADKWFNARRSMRAENVLLGGLTGQSGKRNLNIYWDTQYPHLVDSQLRDVTEVLFHANVFLDNKTNEPIAFQYTIETRYEMRELSPIPAVLLQPYYHLYDSYQPTPPLIQSKSMEEISEMINPDHVEKKKRVRRNNIIE